MTEQLEVSKDESEIVISQGEKVIVIPHAIHIAQYMPGRESPIEPNDFTPEKVAEYLEDLDSRVNIRTIIGLTVHAFDWNTLFIMEKLVDDLNLNNVQIMYCVEAYSIRDESDNNIWSIRQHLGQHIVLIMPGKPTEMFALIEGNGLDPVLYPNDQRFRGMTRFSYIRALKDLGFYSICAHPTERAYPFLDSYLFRELGELKRLGVIDAVELEIDRLVWESRMRRDGWNYIRGVFNNASNLGLKVLVGIDAHGGWHMLERDASFQIVFRSNEWEPDLCPLVGFSTLQNTADIAMSLIELLKSPNGIVVPQFGIPQVENWKSLSNYFNFKEWAEGGIMGMVLKSVLMAYLDEVVYRIRH